jgi:5'-nucleotidase
MIAKTRPWILLTNDDGVAAHGLIMLEQAIAAIGEVYTVAPKDERSGASHSISVRRGLRCEPAPSGASALGSPGERRWSIDGTPADCVIAAMSHILVFPPALVISGINHGGNMGRNIHYSGTVGAAAEAVLHGIPAIAMSLCAKPPADFVPTAKLAARLGERVLKTGLPEGTLLNVNVPVAWQGEVRATRAYRRYSRTMMNELDDREGLWVRESIDWETAPADSDLRAVDENVASVSLVRVYDPPGAPALPFDLAALIA